MKTVGKTLSRLFLASLAIVAVAGLYDWAFWYNYFTFKYHDPLVFSEAMAVFPAKGKVEGGNGTSLNATQDENPFAEVISYAEKMDSDSLLIWQGGRLRVEKYWKDLDRSLRPETASMHKSVVGLLYGAAIADGHIKSVDDAVSLYLPEWEGEVRGNITIRQILNMASGFDPYPPSENPYSDYLRLLYGMRLESLMLRREPVRAPSVKFQYANSNSQLLGLILERATGSPYHQYLSEKIWKPVGAEDAFVRLSGPDGMAYTYAGFLARPQDWLKLGLLIKDKGKLDGRQIMSADWIEAMTTPSKRNPNYGFQIWLSNTDVRKRYYSEDNEGFHTVSSQPFLTDDLVYFDGFGGQRVYISSRHDFVIVRTGPPKREWDDAIMPNAVARAMDAEPVS